MYYKIFIGFLLLNLSSCLLFEFSKLLKNICKFKKLRKLDFCNNNKIKNLSFCYETLEELNCYYSLI